MILNGKKHTKKYVIYSNYDHHSHIIWESSGVIRTCRTNGRIFYNASEASKSTDSFYPHVAEIQGMFKIEQSRLFDEFKEEEEKPIVFKGKSDFSKFQGDVSGIVDKFVRPKDTMPDYRDDEEYREHNNDMEFYDMGHEEWELGGEG